MHYDSIKLCTCEYMAFLSDTQEHSSGAKLQCCIELIIFTQAVLKL